MEEVKLKLDNNGSGAFYILDGEEQVAEMSVNITDHLMKVLHTEVAPEAEGKGLAKDLLNTMADHARKNNLKVQPLCSYVAVQFRRYPEEYADIWNK
jgi:uncharacterized protein